MRRPDPAARWRGAAAALLTVTLSVGAHALAGGPASGAGVALTAVLACALGGFAAGSRHRGTPGLIALLAAGQVLAHLVLAAAGHSHGAAGRSAPLMVGAHAAAVAAGAVLIAAADRLCRALSTAVRALTTRSSWPPEPALIETTSDQPLQSMLLVVASVSHRGPPVGALL
jgi:hypothetical protein